MREDEVSTEEDLLKRIVGGMELRRIGKMQHSICLSLLLVKVSLRRDLSRHIKRDRGGDSRGEQTERERQRERDRRRGEDERETEREAEAEADRERQGEGERGRER